MQKSKHISFTNSFIKAFCQTNKMWVKRDKITKYSTIEINQSKSFSSNTNYDHQKITTGIKETNEKQRYLPRDTKGGTSRDFSH